MIITDAFWEERNIGLSTVEITIDSSDTPCDLQRALGECAAQYCVVKVPNQMIEMNNVLANYGFSFIEALFHVTHDLHPVSLNPVLQRMCDSVSYEQMNSTDETILYNEITKGLFKTDRIALDPFFTSEQASNRYINWLKDEVEKGISLYKLIYKGESIGFFSFKIQKEGVFFPFLAGLYEGRTKMGAVLLLKTIEEARNRKGKNISTFISSNNPDIVRTHVALDYSLAGINYVFIKHAH